MRFIDKYLLPIIVLVTTTIINVFICSAVAGTVFLILISKEINHIINILISICVAVLTYVYMIFNHKLIKIIKERH
jgi:hypothetical protein